VGDIVERRLRNGRRAYYARYVDKDGKRKQRATKQPTLKLAEAWLAQAEARIRAGAVGMVVQTKEELTKANLTVAELGEKFVAGYASPRLKEPVKYRRAAQTLFEIRINPMLGKRTVASLDGQALEELRESLIADKYAPKSVRLTFGTLSKAINWGRRQKLIDCQNPTTGMELPTAEPTMDFLSREEVSKLLDHAQGVSKHPSLYPMIATAIYTGLRKGELYGLTWSAVHLDAARIDVTRSYRLAPKSGKARYLPMHPELVRILRAWRDAWPANDGNLVFAVRGKMGQRHGARWIGKVFKTAGCHVPLKPWHSLRHSFASHFMMSGGNILTLQKLLGHASVTMTMIYAHLAPDFMANEVARLSFPRGLAGVVDFAEEQRKRVAGQQLDTEANASPVAAANA